MPNKRTKIGKRRAEVIPQDVPIADTRPLSIIKVVGISGSGKSTLVAAFRANGYDARPVSQEHSNVPNLWQHFEKATYLIYLYSSLEVQKERRQDVTWTAEAHQEEVRRLAHAREHADLRFNTDGLSPAAVARVAITYLTRRRVRHSPSALAPVPATGSALKPPIGTSDKNS